MVRCVILGAGPIQNTQITRGFVRQDDFILCADGGYAHARRMGLRPDLLIGDFDSVKPPEHAGCEVYSYLLKRMTPICSLRLNAGWSGASAII